MKKSFLIAGIVGAILSTNGHAVQAQGSTVDYSCPSGCTIVVNLDRNGNYSVACVNCPAGTTDTKPVQKSVLSEDTVTIDQLSTPIKQQLNPISSKKPKLNKVSARAAETPKVTKKIVYEEIVSDDDAE